MKKYFLNLTAIITVIALMLSAFTLTSFAENETYSVTITGNNVSLLKGTFGEGALDPTVDYTTTVLVPEGYTRVFFEAYTMVGDQKSYFYDYQYDTNTGELIIPADTVNSDLYIRAHATNNVVDKDNPIENATEISFPFTDTFIPLNNCFIGYTYSDGFYGYAGKVYKAELEKGQQLIIEAYGNTDISTDTFIEIGYYSEENGYIYYNYDNDLYDMGEKAAFVAPEDMTVIINTVTFDYSMEDEVYLSAHINSANELEYADISFEGFNVTADTDAIGEDKLLIGCEYIIPLTFNEDYAVTVEDITTSLNGETFYTEYDIINNNLVLYPSSCLGDVSVRIAAHSEVYEANTDDRVTVIDTDHYEDKFIPAKKAYYSIYLESEDRNFDFAGNCYKIPLEKDSYYSLKASKTEYTDESDIHFLYTVYDKDGVKLDEALHNVGNYGAPEYFTYNSSIEGTLYVSVFDYEGIFEEINVEFDVFKISNETLDFSDTTEDIETENYKWENAANTLTLKDGFNFIKEEVCIVLPENSTLIVNGEVSLTSLISDCITYSGNLDIVLKDDASLNITTLSMNETVGIFSDYQTNNTLTITGEDSEKGASINFNVGFLAIASSDKVVIENCNINAKSGDMGFYVIQNDVIINNSVVTMDTIYECIYGAPSHIATMSTAITPVIKPTNITATNSVLTFTSGEEPIQTTGNVTLTNCITELYTDDEEGIDTNGGAITITGGSLKILSKEDCLQAGDAVTIQNVDLDISTEDTYPIIKTENWEGTSLSGWYCLYDAKGNCIYTGPWQNSFYNEQLELTGVYIDDVFVQAVRMTDTPAPAEGWTFEEDNWVFYENGVKLTNTWKLDSVGWCYLTEDGTMATNEWILDSVGWCYVGSDGYCITDTWMQDSVGWCYLDSNGRMATNTWILDSVGWCYVGSDGYCVTNSWMADSVGWVYLDAEGRMATNQWIMDSVGWCYVGSDGYCITNSWMADSVGWCYLDADGRMVVNDYVYDSNGKCWLDANGYWDGIYY